MEAEYIAVNECAKEIMWMRTFLAELSVPQQGATLIRLDNAGAEALAKNPVHHDRTKHIDVKYRYIRECIENGCITLMHTDTKENLADIFTKPLEKRVFQQHRQGLVD